MREILFKGKRSLERPGEPIWIEGKLNTVFDDSVIITKGTNGKNSIIPIIIKTLCQYTGLSDKKETKIFEGDICRFDNGEPDESERYTNYAVQWDCVNCRYVVVDGYNREDCLDIFFAKHAEVIGNIHDNPEFLAR